MKSVFLLCLSYLKRQFKTRKMYKNNFFKKPQTFFNPDKELVTNTASY